MKRLSERSLGTLQRLLREVQARVGADSSSADLLRRLIDRKRLDLRSTSASVERDSRERDSGKRHRSSRGKSR